MLIQTFVNNAIIYVKLVIMQHQINVQAVKLLMDNSFIFKLIQEVVLLDVVLDTSL